MKIQHITIQTRVFEDEISFYETYAGMAIQRDMRSHGRNMVFLADADGDTQIEIIENSEAEPVTCDALSIGFHAEDLDALKDKLEIEGFHPMPFVTPMPEVRFFFVNDPAGVKVQFI